jgi:hypothetical protein
MFLDEPLTKIIDKETYLSTGENLLRFTNEACRSNGCEGKWNLDNEPECECQVCVMYYAVAKLSIMEHSQEGKMFHERMKRHSEAIMEKTKE